MSDLLDWTALTKEQRIEALKPLVADGLSAGKIALRFVNASRNAIIGYCLRYKISRNAPRSRLGRPVSAATRAKRERAANPLAKPKSAVSARPVVLAKVETEFAELPRPDIVDLSPIARSRAFDLLPGTSPVLLHEATNRQCHWPVSGLEGIEPIFCGASTTKTYCISHQRLAYQPRGYQGAY